MSLRPLGTTQAAHPDIEVIEGALTLLPLQLRQARAQAPQSHPLQILQLLLLQAWPASACRAARAPPACAFCRSQDPSLGPAVAKDPDATGSSALAGCVATRRHAM